MGRNFINKLGNLLRVFKGGKKKEFEKDREDLTDITSESGLRSYDSSSHQESESIAKKLILKKSKSFESLATGTVDSAVNKVNELKRSNGTCDILSNSNDADVKCTKSLHRFGQLTHTNNCVFSYNAKLHDGAIWSQAVGRVAERPRSRKKESTSSSIVQVESQQSQKEQSSNTQNQSQLQVVADPQQQLKRDKSTNAKTDNFNIGSLPTSGSGTESNTRGNEEKHHAVEEMGKENTESPTNIKAAKRLLEVAAPRIDSSLSSAEKTEPSKTLLEEQKMQVKMDVQTVKNQQGFDLLKYDLKSSGDHVVEQGSFLEDLIPSTNDVVIDQTSYESEEQHLNPDDSSKVISENTTEYEVVNLAQVDLFREFKTTISKMRNVLNVLDVKKSLQDVIDRTMSEKKIRKCCSEAFEAENISTQTAAMTFNQISTSTDGGCNQTRNEGIMVQLSSETTSKRVSLNQNLLSQIKPNNKTKRRKKRGYRCKSNKLSRKLITNLSSSQDGKAKIKSDKPHYHKCVVYHITQHKNAVDRCVGTPCHSTKEKMVLKNAFSALHFGPIKEFPMLLDKHENEKNKKELEAKLKAIPSERDHHNDVSSRRRRSTSYLSSDASKITSRNCCHKSKTQPSLNFATSRDHSSMSNTDTTANWFVFNPSPPLLVKEKQSTNSADIVLDKNRSSTQELVSNILQEEFKTSGLKGRISSSTMNMIKDQFCDKLNGVKSKDVPDVMITVCVPLKSIVSKIKTSKKPGCEDKALPASTSTDSHIRLPSSSSYDKSIQVNVSKNYVNDNLQTIPEKMCRKSSEIYQHNKMVRESMSSKRLSTFKKIFGNKATSCSNINPFGHLAPRTSRIYFSDHSTSSPDFATKPVAKESVHFANKKVLTTPKSSSLSIFKEEFGNFERSKREGFFLNLPPNRYRRKRDQISKLFDGSDSSDKKYFGEPKLLYHVHESSFYSTSKTDDRFSSRRLMLESSTSQEKIKAFFPVQQASSRIDINVKPKLISFSDLPRTCDSQIRSKEKVEEKPTKDQGNRKPKPILRNANVNTSNEKIFRDNETQFENDFYELPQTAQKEKKQSKRKARKMVDSENFFNNCIDEFSVVSLAKVHFEDEVNNADCVCGEEERIRNSEDFDLRMNEGKTQGQQSPEERPRKKASILSLFAEDDKTSEKTTEKINDETQEEIQTDKDITAKDRTEGRPKRNSRRKKQTHMILQTSSDSNLIPTDEADHGTDLPPIEYAGPPVKKHKRKRSRDIVRVESTQVDSVTSLPRTENFLVQVEAPNETKNENKLTGLIRDVVNLCNSSFVKSRDCIVELTLYNLIKEIILEHCSHLSEQSRQKVESILANFIKVSKQKVGDDNVEIVESAIENLVKEIGTTESPNKQLVDDHIEEDSEQDRKREHKHRRKHSRSKSKRREHKHESKHRSRRREYDIEHREKHRHKDSERRHRSKRHHKHHCDTEEICEIGQQDSEVKFRSVEGKREYLELVQRLKELEAVTKQLSNVAQNQQSPYMLLDGPDRSRRNTKVYTTSLVEKPDFVSNKKMKFSLSEVERLAIGKEVQKEPVNVNFFQTEPVIPVVPIPRNYPKLPVTKIVINLSNLKLLTRNCVSLTGISPKEPVVITDSTEEKQKLINKIVSYRMDNGYRSKVRHSSRHLSEVDKHRMKDNRSEIINKNKESFTITIHGKDKRKTKYSKEVKVKSSRPSKDFMKIKMVRKKKTVTSTSDQTASDSYCSKRKKEDAKSKDIQRITKEYIKREYKLNSDILCASIAKDLLENKCNVNQVLDYRGNLDLAYQRMANFCLFRGLLRKESNCD